jgi:hypothetical protein
MNSCPEITTIIKPFPLKRLCKKKQNLPVVPAEAGIQPRNSSGRAADIQYLPQYHVRHPFGILKVMDSRLRGNDKGN